MRSTAVGILVLGILFSCAPDKPKNLKANSTSSISGTWQLIKVETIQGGETTIDHYTNGIKGIKMFNETHFSFFQHDLEQGKDSTALFVSGGGSYTLVDGSYNEYLEYCNFREYENNSFEFQVAIKGDTLIQKGQEEVEEIGIDKYIIETYVRVEL